MWTVTAYFLNQILADLINAYSASHINGILEAVWLGLYITPTTPISPQSTLANITEANYDGYARQEVVWYPPYTDFAGPQTLTGVSMNFSPTDATVPNLITGLFLATAGTGGNLLMAQALASPGMPLQMLGESLILLPQFQMSYGPNYGGVQIAA